MPGPAIGTPAAEARGYAQVDLAHRVERGEERRKDTTHPGFVERVDVLAGDAFRDRVDGARPHSRIGGMGSAIDE
jgi:hypothetical protein